MLIQSVLSVEYVKVPVSAEESGAAVDITADVVEMAFPLQDVAPVSGDWETAAWETDATTTPDTYLARCLVGPGGAATLVVGTYDVYVRVTDTPEVVVRRAGNLKIV
jgi:hypothetical protein